MEAVHAADIVRDCFRKQCSFPVSIDESSIGIHFSLIHIATINESGIVI